MQIQVLVASLNQSDHSLVKKMNIHTDAIIGNQCDYNSVEDFQIDDNNIKYLNFNERGVGLNRNNALMRATGDILVFADDDEILVDNYDSIIKKAYAQLPDADAIIFNIVTSAEDKEHRRDSKIRRARIYNCLNYGAPRITVLNNSVKKHNITFHSQFGGGAIYSSGEDSLFIGDMISNKLKVYIYPAVIAYVDQTTSTWFKGYNEKYFYDKGVFFAALAAKFGRLLCLLLLFKNRKRYFNNTSELIRGIKRAMKGYRDFKRSKNT